MCAIAVSGRCGRWTATTSPRLISNPAIALAKRRLIAEIGMTIEAIDGDVVVGRDIPSMACARLGDAFRTVDGLLPKADDAHSWLLRSGALRWVRRARERISRCRLGLNLIRPRNSINLVFGAGAGRLVFGADSGRIADPPLAESFCISSPNCLGGG